MNSQSDETLAAARWFGLAASELARLQGDFRELQKQSHAVIAVGGAIVGAVSLGGAQSSPSLAALVAVLVYGITMSWYLNINAESVAVGCARDVLGVELNRALTDAGQPRAIYSDAVQAAGRKALSTIVLLGLIGLIGAGLATGGLWIAWQDPGALGSEWAVSNGWRQGLQVIATALSIFGVCLSIAENMYGYEARFRKSVGMEQPTRADVAP